MKRHLDSKSKYVVTLQHRGIIKEVKFQNLESSDIQFINYYSRTCLQRPPHGPYKYGLSRHGRW